MKLPIIVTVLLVVASSEGANILIPIWFPGLSHFLMFRRLFVALAERGHNVTVLGHHPLKTPIKNYNDISIRGSLPLLNDNMTMDFVATMRQPVTGVAVLISFTNDFCLKAYDAPQVQQLANSDDHYDLVISEYFHTDCMAVFAHKFKAPLIGITSSMALPTVHDRVGNPEHPAYTEQYDVPLKAPFSFFDRVHSTVMHQLLRVVNWWMMDASIERRIREVFGEDTPPLQQVFRNTSLVLVNSHWSVDQAVPTVPAFIEVGGLHVEEPKPLSEDLQKYLDDSPHGVIYFSLGSMVRIETFPPEKYNAILDVFASVPQRILWKSDPSTLPALPPNVRVQKWIPQNDVLNHKNVRVFITHGGLLGMQEAIRAGVPTLNIPLFSDQFVNAAKVAGSGNGLRLLYEDITYDSLRGALDALVNETRYRERAKHLSRLFRDRPRPPLEEAIYWVEYVIRHRGAPHLRSAALDLAWYQYLLLDVVAFVVLVTSFGILTLYLVFRKVLSHLLKSRRIESKLKSS